LGSPGLALSPKDADMMIYPMILLLLVPGQQKPNPDTPEDRARRAAIVDRIMAQPALPQQKVRRMVPEIVEPAPEQQPDDFARKRAAREAVAARVRAPMQIHVADGKRQMILTIEQPVLDEPDGEIDQPEPVMQMGFNLNNSVLERQNFDRWVFGDGVDEEGRRIRLQSRLSEKIDRVMKDHKINLAQLQKLRLAGSGDIKRYLDRVEERRPEFEAVRKNFNTGWQMLRQLEPLTKEFQEGPFGDDSFFTKTLKKIENDSAASKNEQ
jgi:hypothetical protein